MINNNLAYKCKGNRNKKNNPKNTEIQIGIGCNKNRYEILKYTHKNADDQKFKKPNFLGTRHYLLLYPFLPHKT